MELNNIQIASITPINGGSSVGMLLEGTTMEAALALGSDGVYEVTRNGQPYRTYQGYQTVEVGKDGDFTRLVIARELEPDTAAAIKGIEANMATVGAQVETLQSASASVQAQLDALAGV